MKTIICLLVLLLSSTLAIAEDSSNNTTPSSCKTVIATQQSSQTIRARKDINDLFFGGLELSKTYYTGGLAEVNTITIKNEEQVTSITIQADINTESERLVTFNVSDNDIFQFGTDHDIRKKTIELNFGNRFSDQLKVQLVFRNGRNEFDVTLFHGFGESHNFSVW